MSKHLTLTTLLICFISNIYAQTDENLRLINFVRNNDTQGVIQSLENGASPDAFDYDGIYALMYAADNGNNDICQILLDKGADPNAVPLHNDAPTALIAAVQQNYPITVDLLLLNGARSSVTDSSGRNAMFYAIKNGEAECVQVLLYHHASSEQCSKKASALQYAAALDDTLICRILVDAGAGINNIFNNRSAYSVACENSAVNAMNYLKSAGARDSIDVNNLFYASCYADTATIGTLLRNGTDAKQKDLKNCNACDLAIMSGRYDNAYYLRRNHIHPSKLFIPVGVSFSFANELADNAYRLGLDIGFIEKRFGFSFHTSFMFSPAYGTVWIKKGEHLYWQLREKRRFVNFELRKDFSLSPMKRPDFGAFLSYKFSMYYGKYDGSVEEKPDHKNFNVPIAGLYLRGRSFGISAAYEFYYYKDQRNSPQDVINISFTTFINKQHYDMKKFYY